MNIKAGVFLIVHACRRCTFAASFKVLSLTGAAWLLAANTWGFEADEDVRIEANLEVTGQLTVGSVDTENSSGIVTSGTDITDSANNTTLATSAAIKDHVKDAIVKAGWGYPTSYSSTSTEAKNFQDAVEYCAGSIDGHNDWRLPTFPELISVCFDCTGSDKLWTATPTKNNEWVAFKPLNVVYDYAQNTALYVRCVR